MKTTSWRAVATITTIVISFYLTGSFATALKLGPIDFVTKFFAFYLHERLWLLPSLQNLNTYRLWKTCSWKLVAITLIMTTTVIVTGEYTLALKLGPMVSKMFLCRITYIPLIFKISRTFRTLP